MDDRLRLVAVLAANAISLLGNVLAAVAIPWFVLEQTGSALQTGIAAVFASAPLAIGAFFGGAVTDRIGPRRASVLGDIASAASVAGIPFLHASGHLEFWHLLALAFLGSLFDAPAASAREAMLPDLARRAGWRTERVTSLTTATEHGAYVLGAPVAGILIASIGAPALLWIDAATFVAAAALVAIGGRVGPGRGELRTSVLDVLGGLRTIRRDPALLTIMLAATGGAFFIDPLTPVLLPVYVDQRFDSPAALGLAVGAYGIGGLLGIVVFLWLAGRFGRTTMYRSLWLAYAAVSFGLVLLPPLGLLLPVLVVIGVTTGAIDPLERAVRLDRTPAAQRGRVFSAMYAVPKVVVPAGVFAAGALIEGVGLTGALAAFAIGNLAIAVAVAILPITRSLDEPARPVGRRRSVAKAPT